MDSEELEKIDQIPTSNKPWYFRHPFIGIMLFVVFVIGKIIIRYLES